MPNGRNTSSTSKFAEFKRASFRSYNKFFHSSLLQYSFLGDLFMVADDPLGRNGPSIDVFLSNQQPIQNPFISSTNPSFGNLKTSNSSGNFFKRPQPLMEQKFTSKQEQQLSNNFRKFRFPSFQQKPEHDSRRKDTLNSKTSSSSSSRSTSRSRREREKSNSSRRKEKKQVSPDKLKELATSTSMSSLLVSREDQRVERFRDREMLENSVLYEQLLELFPNKSESKIKNLLYNYPTLRDLNFFVTKLLEEE